MTVAVLLIAALTSADSAAVLMYHRFGEDRYPSTSIRVDQFDEQLQHLRDADYEVIPLAELLNALTDGSTLPDRAVVITIDDAYRSVYEVAYPRLRQFGFPFTVFVATDPVDDELPDFMSWDQMREMAAHGATFANHGAAHLSVIEREAGEPAAARLERVRADIDRGWRRLSEELNPLPGIFAYPYGEYDSRSAAMLRDMGYAAFGQQSGAVGPSSDLRALPRFPVAEDFGDLEQFRTKVASLPMPVLAVEPWDPVVSTRRPRIDVRLDESEARMAELACFVGGQGRAQVEWLEPGRHFRVGPATAFEAGRQRVNCTAPGDDGRYLWFSHPWIVRPPEKD